MERRAGVRNGLLTVTLVLFAWGVVGSVARAEPRAYFGPHPLDLDGTWHTEEAFHAHEDAPIALEAYADVDGVLVFLGDPVAYGYRGDTWTYDGSHPLPGSLTGYCAVSGTHRHPFLPGGDYRRDPAGAYVFAGALRGGPRSYRPGRVVPDVAVPATTQSTTYVQAPLYWPPACTYVTRRVNGHHVSVEYGDPLVCGGGTPHHVHVDEAPEWRPPPPPRQRRRPLRARANPQRFSR